MSELEREGLRCQSDSVEDGEDNPDGSGRVCWQAAIFKVGDDCRQVQLIGALNLFTVIFWWRKLRLTFLFTLCVSLGYACSADHWAF